MSNAATTEKRALYAALATQLAGRWCDVDAWVDRDPVAWETWCALDTAVVQARWDDTVSVAQFRVLLARLAATFCVDRETESREEGDEAERER